MHKNANGSIKHHVYHSWLVWVTFLFAIHFKTHFICQAYKSLKNESFLIWMIIKSLVLWVLGTELRLISNWYVHHHIVLEAYGLVVTDWVVFPMLGQGVRRLFTGPSWVWSRRQQIKHAALCSDFVTSYSALVIWAPCLITAHINIEIPVPSNQASLPLRLNNSHQ